MKIGDQPARLANNAVLLCALLAFFLVFPFLSEFFVAKTVLNIFLTLILLGAAYAVLGDRRLRAVVTLLALLALASGWMGEFLGTSHPLNLVRYALLTAVFALTAGILLMDVLRPGPVTLNKITGAINVYLLMGVVWTGVFAILETISPGSFNLPAAGPNAGEREILADFFYYSFITLSTLGYGDITPLTGPARSLAALEAIMGQLYIAVLIASLVGLHISQADRQGGSGE